MANGKNLNIIKSMHKKPTANVILNGVKAGSDPTKAKNETRVNIRPTPF